MLPGPDVYIFPKFYLLARAPLQTHGGDTAYRHGERYSQTNHHGVRVRKRFRRAAAQSMNLSPKDLKDTSPRIPPGYRQYCRPCGLGNKCRCCCPRTMLTPVSSNQGVICDSCYAVARMLISALTAGYYYCTIRDHSLQGHWRVAADDVTTLAASDRGT